MENFLNPFMLVRLTQRGSRKGGLTYDSALGNSLRDRLRQHASSINEASNLELNDFYFRALTVDDIWIPLGENVLIQKFQPLWNRVIDGFGNKTPGKGRAIQKRSSWDVLHPGRRFVEKLALSQNALTIEDINRKIINFYQGKLNPKELLSLDDEDKELNL